MTNDTAPPKRIWACAGCGLQMPGNCDCVTNVATSWEPDHRMVLKGQLRMETTSEHIARDMSEGRFPERSDPQVVVIPEAERKMILASEAEAMVAAALREKLAETHNSRAEAERDRLAAANAALEEKVRGLVEVGQRILDRGYVSEFIEEERGDYLALAAALATQEADPGETNETDLMNFVRWACDAPSLHQVQQRASQLLEKKNA